MVAAEFLTLQMRSDDGQPPRDLLQEKFSCFRMFAALRFRLQRVWSLQSTMNWDSEDLRAAQDDEMMCATQLRALGTSVGTTDAEIASYYHRRSTSEWKVDLEAEVVPVAGTSVFRSTFTPWPGAEGQIKMYVDDAECSFRRAESTWRCVHKALPVGVPPSSETLEAFVVDSCNRVHWCHPGIVSTRGVYTQRVGPDGMPTLAMGALLELLPHPLFAPLDYLLYRRGMRFALVDAIDITLQVADAVQYILFDNGDVKDVASRTWHVVPPSNVFLRHSDNVMWSDENSTLVPLRRIGAAQKMHRFTAVISPRFYVDESPPTRWEPHPQASSPVTYCLTQLLLALITNAHPYPLAITTDEISATLSPPEDDGVRHSVHRGFSVPSRLAPSVRAVCEQGLRIGVEEGLSLSDFRKTLYALRSDFCGTYADGDEPHEQVEPDLDDYGYCEAVRSRANERSAVGNSD